MDQDLKDQRVKEDPRQKAANSREKQLTFKPGRK